MIDRSALLGLLRSSLLAHRYDFARAAALDWLAVWPGDSEVQHVLAQAETALGHDDLALERLLSIVARDPEDTSAHLALAEGLRRKGEAARARVFAACGRALRGTDPDRNATPPWAAALTRAYQALAKEDTATALQQAALALSADPESSLPTLVALKAHLALGDRAAAAALASASHKRWPECVALRLVHASSLLEAGETAAAVEALHRASVDDPTGAVTHRWLGSQHAYHDLWPTELVAHLSRPVPADIAAVMGDNRLASGPASTVAPATSTQVSAAKSAPAPVLEPDEDLPQPEPWEAFRGPGAGEQPRMDDAPDPVGEAQQEMVRLAVRMKVPRPAKDQDRRMPAYILLSAETRLLQQFGPEGFKKVDRAVRDLNDAVRRRKGWSAHRIYVDDPGSLTPFGLSPADPGNAWQIKLRLADLDAALRRKGEMIGAVLIVGGDEVIPFHRLPNPTDDDDETVPSDNPYSTTDENYFAPEWPVGRIPVDSDAELLIRQLMLATQAHRAALAPRGPLARVRAWIAARLGRLACDRRAFGYTASIWRRSSLAVYRSIGEPRSLMTSPPAQAGALPALAQRAVRNSYFNLHGLEDAPEWFGQRDPVRDPEAAEFPVAMGPKDVVNSGRAPKVVFTEACYGANTLGKTSETALCLKFLASGSEIVVGSTKISYGSVTPPLIAADFLGRAFWDLLAQGVPAGEALRRAKTLLAGEMIGRQGYLDGEDQKTLISFVLYGDPLYISSTSRSSLSGKAVVRRTTRPAEIRTACALNGESPDGPGMDEASSSRVRSIVSHYLPGMSDARAAVHRQHCGCSGEGHCCPTSQIGSKQMGHAEPGTTVVTLSKSVAEGSHRHAKYARLTLDPAGKVLKLAVSR